MQCFHCTGPHRIAKCPNRHLPPVQANPTSPTTTCTCWCGVDHLFKDFLLKRPTTPAPPVIMSLNLLSIQRGKVVSVPLNMLTRLQAKTREDMFTSKRIPVRKSLFKTTRKPIHSSTSSHCCLLLPVGLRSQGLCCLLVCLFLCLLLLLLEGRWQAQGLQPTGFDPYVHLLDGVLQDLPLRQSHLVGI